MKARWRPTIFISFTLIRYHAKHVSWPRIFHNLLNDLLVYYTYSLATCVEVGNDSALSKNWPEIPVMLIKLSKLCCIFYKVVWEPFRVLIELQNPGFDDVVTVSACYVKFLHLHQNSTTLFWRRFPRFRQRVCLCFLCEVVQRFWRVFCQHSPNMPRSRVSDVNIAAGTSSSQRNLTFQDRFLSRENLMVGQCEFDKKTFLFTLGFIALLVGSGILGVVISNYTIANLQVRHCFDSSSEPHCAYVCELATVSDSWRNKLQRSKYINLMRMVLLWMTEHRKSGFMLRCTDVKRTFWADFQKSFRNDEANDAFWNGDKMWSSRQEENGFHLKFWLVNLFRRAGIWGS